MRQVLDDETKQKMWFAFANGVVPKGIDKEWLFGRANEFDGLTHVLEQIEKNNMCGFRLLEGDYGTGKTSILSAFEYEALSRGFVVSKVTLGQQNNLSKPEILYKDIMSHLKMGISDKVSDFEEIFDRWLKETKENGDSHDASKKIYSVIKELQNYHPSFANVLLVYIRGKINNDIELTSLASAWIKGDYNIPYHEKKRLNIKGNIDRHNAFDILKGFSKLVKLLGFKGLVICIDELEWIMNERSDIRNKSYTTIRQLIDEIGENSWTNTYFLGAHTPEIMEDSNKGFKSYQALYQRITSGFDDRGLVTDFKNLTTIVLKPLPEEEFITMGLKIIGLKEVAVSSDTLCNLALVECRRKQQSSDQRITPRIYIKNLIHLIEMAESNPNMPIFKVKTK